MGTFFDVLFQPQCQHTLCTQVIQSLLQLPFWIHHLPPHPLPGAENQFLLPDSSYSDLSPVACRGVFIALPLDVETFVP